MCVSPLPTSQVQSSPARHCSFDCGHAEKSNWRSTIQMRSWCDCSISGGEILACAIAAYAQAEASSCVCAGDTSAQLRCFQIGRSAHWGNFQESSHASRSQESLSR